jgi:hypothetical protein
MAKCISCRGGSSTATWDSRKRLLENAASGTAQKEKRKNSIDEEN